MRDNDKNHCLVNTEFKCFRSCQHLKLEIIQHRQTNTTIKRLNPDILEAKKNLPTRRQLQKQCQNSNFRR